MTDLYRPLGLDRPANPVRRLPPVAARHLMGALMATALVGGSLATSLMQPQMRRPDGAAPANGQGTAIAAVNAARVAPPAPMPDDALRPQVSLAPAADPDQPVVTYPPGETGSYGRLVSVRDPETLRQDPRAASEPDEALTEAGAEGPLPIRASDGRRPFDVYQTAPAADRGVRVAIVVGGLGISQTGTLKAIQSLPAGVTLAFASAGNSLERWRREARRTGHELLLQLPMEPIGYPDVSPGAQTLTASDAAAGRFDALRWSLGRLTNYVGVMNYMGARLTGDVAAMRALAAELARRGLMYLDDGSSSRSLARDAAGEAGTVFAGAELVLDADQSAQAIGKRLDMLERAARANGQAIGIASAFDTSVATIAAWIEEAERRGISVVPVSALASDPEAR